MGRPKAHLDAGGGETFAERISRVAAEAGLAPRLLVTSTTLAPTFDTARLHGASIVENHDPGDGPISSIRVAIRRLEASAATGLAVWPVDTPFVTADTVRRLLAAAVAGGAIVVPLIDGRRGHPAFFAREIWSELLGPPSDRGARAVVRSDRSRVVEVPVEDASVLLDIDTPDAYRRARRDDATEGRRLDADTSA